jgi:hypothetical protein
MALHPIIQAYIQARDQASQDFRQQQQLELARQKEANDIKQFEERMKAEAQDRADRNKFQDAQIKFQRALQEQTIRNRAIDDFTSGRLKPSTQQSLNSSTQNPGAFLRVGEPTTVETLTPMQSVPNPFGDSPIEIPSEQIATPEEMFDLKAYGAGKLREAQVAAEMPVVQEKLSNAFAIAEENRKAQETRAKTQAELSRERIAAQKEIARGNQQVSRENNAARIAAANSRAAKGDGSAPDPFKKAPARTREAVQKTANFIGTLDRLMDLGEKTGWAVHKPWGGSFIVGINEKLGRNSKEQTEYNNILGQVRIQAKQLAELGASLTANEEKLMDDFVTNTNMTPQKAQNAIEVMIRERGTDLVGKLKVNGIDNDEAGRVLNDIIADSSGDKSRRFIGRSKSSGSLTFVPSRRKSEVKK